MQPLWAIALVPHNLEDMADLAFEPFSMATAPVMQNAYHTAGCTVEVLRAELGEQAF